MAITRTTILEIVAVAAQTIGSLLQNVISNFWMSGLKAVPGGPYFILLFCSALYLPLFGIYCLVSYIYRQSRGIHDQKTETPYVYRPHGKEQWRSIILAGVFDALNGFTTMYTLSLVSPLLQTVLGNTSFLFAFFFGYMILQKEVRSYFKTRAVGAKTVLLLVANFALVVLVVVPTMVSPPPASSSSTPGSNTTRDVLGITVFVISVALGSIYNLFQKRFMDQAAPYLSQDKQKRLSEETYDERQAITATPPPPSKMHVYFVMLFWNCLFQLLTVLVIWPLALIPGVDVSNAALFWQHLGNQFQCNFNTYTGPYVDPTVVCTSMLFLYNLLFNLGYAVTYVASAHLNTDSVTFSVMSVTVGGAFSLVVFIFFPALGNQDLWMPIWIVIPVFVLQIVGLIAWRWWEKVLKTSGTGEAEHLVPKQKVMYDHE